MTKPILFNSEMVQALLEGRKTQTRRVISHRLMQNADVDNLDSSYVYLQDEYGDSHHVLEYCPFGKVGNLLWVCDLKEHRELMIEITNIRVERLQDISEEDAKAEGVTQSSIGFQAETKQALALRNQAFRQGFYKMWESINAKHESKRWQANPWVWCVSFNVINRNIKDINDV